MFQVVKMNNNGNEGHFSLKFLEYFPELKLMDEIFSFSKFKLEIKLNIFKYSYNINFKYRLVLLKVCCTTKFW